MPIKQRFGYVWMNTRTAIHVKSLIRDRENKEVILRLGRHKIYLSIDMKTYADWYW